jgi:hypothetical protein
MKWVMIVAVLGIGYMIYTGNMGGAKKATGNYIKVKSNKQSDGAEARPNLMHQLIEYNKKNK